MTEISAVKEPLAILGGPKVVTTEYAEPWPLISDEEVEAVTAQLRTGQISIGDGTGVIGEFESDFARYQGSKYALMQNSGTSTLHAAYFALGVGPGDEVIVPTYTWHASASPVLACNGVPVFCDVDEKCFTADPEDIERKITAATKAICVVHLWGHPAEMDDIMAVAKRHGLPVVEDCSHAHGATYKGRKVGTFGDIACFSLQGSKAMVAGEGGVVVTENPSYFDRMLALGHYGRLDKGFVTEELRDIAFTGFGWKYRPHPLAAAIARVQLRHLDERIKARRENLDYLTAALTGIPGITPSYTAPHATRGGYYGYRLLYDAGQLGVSTARFIDALRAEGVDAIPERYRLLHFEKLYNGYDMYGKGCPYRCDHVEKPRANYKAGDFPVAERLYPKLVALPTFTLQPCWDVLDQYAVAFKKVIGQIELLQDGSPGA